MKNYYDQRRELRIAEIRLETLKAIKELYFDDTQPGGISYDTERVEGGQTINPFDRYVSKIEEIDKKIKVTEEEINILQNNLACMENVQKELQGSLEKIFTLRYIEGLSINQICKITHYSKSEIYRKLDLIEKKLKTGKNGKNTVV